MKLREKARKLPKEPGVYLMQDARGRIIYVGKAKSLRNRVSSYFQSDKNLRFKTKILVDNIVDFEYIITDTEVEALILENNLIKKHHPKYNIQLKDDKTYPYIKVTLEETYPRIFKTRIVKKDGSRYFGPYTDAKAVNDILELIQNLFSLRTCKRELGEKKESRACLNYHIEKCVGPCINKISVEEYNILIDKGISILEGKENKLIKGLEEEMGQASKELNFEQAAKLRDQIRAIDKITQKQKVVSDKLIDQDIIALAKEDDDICVQLLIVRSGRLIGKEDFIFNKVEDRNETLAAFLKQYYNNVYYIPEEIIIESEIEDLKLIEGWLSSKRGTKVDLQVPKQGKKKELIQMAYRNARYNLKEYRFKKKFKSINVAKGVAQLQEHLGLEELPYRIEGFDISHVQGTDTVASLVVFENGKPKKSDYRRFKIKTVEGVNDFASMEEVVYRRYSGLLKRGEDFPDLILIDGGKGQLSSAVQILNELGRGNEQIIGLAKREEEVFLPGQSEPIILPRDSQALYLIQRVRDEAHRFAVSYHRKLRSRRLTHSMLDEIPRIAKKRRNALLKHFGSLDKIKRASEEELAQVEGISYKLAGEIRDYLDEHLKV
ncbi:excinuclease ABC subunit UvrC [Halonatronum saccharophilum]|uniref:excinuclease ABC subunit UvrC n=1 Tax=Halonatronum saccharophilum TaxID=150060 RepID=UPI000480E9C5|nr:excinuclease ABC subunit UvrC [Halonatronum saccharophilum]